MPKFALENMADISGKIGFWKLRINGKCKFDLFSNEVEKMYSTELSTIISYMVMVANGYILPETKYRLLEGGSKDGGREFEFKSKHLRVYGFQQKDGNIVVIGGYKKDQQKDISKLRNIKKEFLKR